MEGEGLLCVRPGVEGYSSCASVLWRVSGCEPAPLVTVTIFQKDQGRSTDVPCNPVAMRSTVPVIYDENGGPYSAKGNQFGKCDVAVLGSEELHTRT